jgi:hypothetical protein
MPARKRSEDKQFLLWRFGDSTNHETLQAIVLAQIRTGKRLHFSWICSGSRVNAIDLLKLQGSRFFQTSTIVEGEAD